MVCSTGARRSLSSKALTGHWLCAIPADAHAHARHSMCMCCVTWRGRGQPASLSCTMQQRRGQGTAYYILRHASSTIPRVCTLSSDDEVIRGLPLGDGCDPQFHRVQSVMCSGHLIWMTSADPMHRMTLALDNRNRATGRVAGIGFHLQTIAQMC